MTQQVPSPFLCSRKFWGVVLPFVLYIGICMLPSPEGLSVMGQKSIALMAAAIAVWLLEPIAVSFSAPLFVLLQVPLGLCTMPAAVSNFASPLFIFIFILFCLAIAMENSGLTHRLALYATIRSKGSPTRLIVFFICLSSLASTVVADIPVCAMLLPVSLAILQRNNVDIRGSNFGSALLIGVGIGSLIGGIGTPAGSAMNMLVIQLLSTNAHIDISFLEWSLIGMPMVILLTPCICLVICKLLPGEIVELRGMDEAYREYEALGPLSSKEIRFLVIFGINILLWYTDKLHHMPMQVSAMICVAVLALPGVDILDWKRDRERVNWDAIMLVGGSVAVATGMYQAGAAAWIAENVMGGFTSMPVLVLITVICIFTMIIQLLIPTSSAVVAVMGPPLLALAVAKGINPAALVIPLGICSSACMLTPINANYLIMCKFGYTRIKDMYIVGVPLCILWAIVLLGVMRFIGAPLGFM